MISSKNQGICQMINCLQKTRKWSTKRSLGPRSPLNVKSQITSTIKTLNQPCPLTQLKRATAPTIKVNHSANCFKNTISLTVVFPCSKVATLSMALLIWRRPNNRISSSEQAGCSSSKHLRLCPSCRLIWSLRLHHSLSLWCLHRLVLWTVSKHLNRIPLLY